MADPRVTLVSARGTTTRPGVLRTQYPLSAGARTALPAPGAPVGAAADTAYLHNQLFLAERRIQDLTNRLMLLAEEKGSRAEVTRLTSERDSLRKHLIKLLARDPRLKERQYAQREFQELRDGFYRKWAEADDLEAQLHGVHKDYQTELQVAHNHMRGLVAENANAKHTRDILARDQRQMAMLDRRMRSAREDLDRRIADFERARYEHERRLFSRDEISELRDLRARVGELRHRLVAKEKEGKVLEKQFLAEFEARQEAERSARYGPSGQMQALQQSAIDDMQLELFQLRQESREIEREKTQEILLLKQHARAANDERNQAINRFLNARDVFAQSQVAAQQHIAQVIHQHDAENEQKLNQIAHAHEQHLAQQQLQLQQHLAQQLAQQPQPQPQPQPQSHPQPHHQPQPQPQPQQHVELVYAYPQTQPQPQPPLPPQPPVMMAPPPPPMMMAPPPRPQHPPVPMHMPMPMPMPMQGPMIPPQPIKPALSVIGVREVEIPMPVGPRVW